MTDFGVFLNELMKLGVLGAGIMLFLGVVYAWAVAGAKASVEPVEPEPGDRVHTMDDGDENENYHGVK